MIRRLTTAEVDELARMRDPRIATPDVRELFDSHGEFDPRRAVRAYERLARRQIKRVRKARVAGPQRCGQRQRAPRTGSVRRRRRAAASRAQARAPGDSDDPCPAGGRSRHPARRRSSA